MYCLLLHDFVICCLYLVMHNSACRFFARALRSSPSSRSQALWSGLGTRLADSARVILFMRKSNIWNLRLYTHSTFVFPSRNAGRPLSFRLSKMAERMEVDLTPAVRDKKRFEVKKVGSDKNSPLM